VRPDLRLLRIAHPDEISPPQGMNMDLPNASSDAAAQLRPVSSSDEQRYRGIFEHAIEGIFQTTPDGHYIAPIRTGADLWLRLRRGIAGAPFRY
jgi:hypothetical protein